MEWGARGAVPEGAAGGGGAGGVGPAAQGGGLAFREREGLGRDGIVGPSPRSRLDIDL